VEYGFAFTITNKDIVSKIADTNVAKVTMPAKATATPVEATSDVQK
jgi:hypothetical protein